MTRRHALLAFLLALSGCGGPPPPPPTVVNLSVAAGPRSNGGAPVSVRVYQLTSPTAFESAGFFPLFNGDAAVLKDDLVKRDDLLLAPGQSRAMLITPPDRVKAIGVFAAFQNYEKLSWRALAAIPPNAASDLSVLVTDAGVSARLDPAKPASKP